MAKAKRGVGIDRDWAIFPVASSYLHCTASAVVPALTFRPPANNGEINAAAIS